MQNNIKYRVLMSDDINLYREIRLDCLQNYPQNFGISFENERETIKLKFDDILKNKKSTSFLYGAFLEEKIIGICGFIRETSLKSKHRGKISQMYVKDEFAGQKIGAQLLHLTLKKAFDDTTLELIELGVIKENQKAMDLYLKFGFVAFGQFEKYFKFKENYSTMIFMVLAKSDFLN